MYRYQTTANKLLVLLLLNPGYKFKKSQLMHLAKVISTRALNQQLQRFIKDGLPLKSEVINQEPYITYISDR